MPVNIGLQNILKILYPCFGWMTGRVNFRLFARLSILGFDSSDMQQGVVTAFHAAF